MGRAWYTWDSEVFKVFRLVASGRTRTSKCHLQQRKENMLQHQQRMKQKRLMSFNRVLDSTLWWYRKLVLLEVTWNLERIIRHAILRSKPESK
jgi:hypothetical protein